MCSNIPRCGYPRSDGNSLMGGGGEGSHGNNLLSWLDHRYGDGQQVFDKVALFVLVPHGWIVQRWCLRGNRGRSSPSLSCLSASIQSWFGKHRVLGPCNPWFPIGVTSVDLSVTERTRFRLEWRGPLSSCSQGPSTSSLVGSVLDSLLC